MENKEVKVPVPWGHIAVKVWGDETNPAVLTIHGLLDNAGSWDRLLVMLPTNFCYYAIDLPGHGLSSHWSQHALIHTADNLLAYKAVTDFFNRKEYVIMGHSWGAQIGQLFAIVYPEIVTKLIILDALSISLISSEQFKKTMSESHRQYFTTMEKLSKLSSTTYTREEVLYRLMNNRLFGSISRDAAERLMIRAVTRTTDGKLTFNFDQRLKFVMNLSTNFPYITDVLRIHPIKCPVLIILSTESSSQKVDFKPVLDVYEKSKNFTIHIVEGSHDVHMNHPERVTTCISDFLIQPILKKNAKL